MHKTRLNKVVLCCCCYKHLVDEDGVHILEDGNFYFEIEGLPEKDPEDDIFPLAKKASKVRFSASPMRV
jgi:PDZ domain